MVLGMPSTDAEARAVAIGEAPFDRLGAKGCDTARFAAWTVEARSECQLVMCDYQGRTRSWFMVLRQAQDGREGGTRVYFGTAIAAGRGGRIPFAFRLLMPFHHLYSRALLWSAVRRLRAG